MSRAALAYADAPPERWSIAELAAEFAVTPRTIRFYEGEGLIAPAREGTQRVYGKADRARLAWILRAKRVGFSLADVGQMIDLYDLPDGRATQRRVTIAKCRERVVALERQRADLDACIDELSQFIRLIENHKPSLKGA